MKLKILVGTMTGTATMVAQAILMECANQVSTVEIKAMDDLDISVFGEENPQDVIYLICTSTYGAGDVPGNAQALYQSLDTEPRYLGHVRYGVMGLGDTGTHQSTFCFGARKFDERLQDLGAQRLGELWCHDASGDTLPEAAGAQWCRQWLQEALLRN